MSEHPSPLSIEAPPGQLRGYFELLRLPNVFTAMADVLMGYLFTHPSLEPWLEFSALLVASSALYLAGMVLNDVCDRDVDATKRPGRPIPSGRVSLAAARRLTGGLFIVGLAMGGLATFLSGSLRPGLVTLLLAVAIVLYDAVLKQTPLAPLAMGACRLVNVLLGMSLAPGPWSAVHWVVAAGVGVYVVGVTWFARTEADVSNRLTLAAATLVILVGVGLLADYPRWWPELALPSRWYAFWAMLALLIGWRCLRAVLDPRPAVVQMAVKNCILSLIFLDAAACFGVQQDPFWPAMILALLLPSVVLGRWIYST